MRSIRAKLIIRIICLVDIVAIAIGAVSLVFLDKSTRFALETVMHETAEIAADNITANIKVYKAKTTDVGYITALSDENIPNDVKNGMLTELKQLYEFQDLIVTDTSAKVLAGSTASIPNLANETFFQEAVNKKTAISSPIVDEQTKKAKIYVAAPLWKDGQINTSVVGCVVSVLEGDIFSKLANDVCVGEKGETFIINENGTLIGYNDHSLVEAQDNVILISEEVKELRELAAVQKKLLNGETGYQEYNYMGVPSFAAYTPIEETNGWGIGVTISKSEFFSYTNTSIFLITLITIGSALLATIIAILFARNIVKPIVANIKRLQLLSQGDFTSPVPVVKTKDETKQLADAITTTIDSIKQIIYDIDNNIKKISNKDLAIDVSTTYPGDLETISTAMKTLAFGLNNILGQVHTAASQVEVGANQVADGAQAISQGATEQASSLQELSASINEISNHVKQTAIHANDVNTMVKTVGGDLDNSYRQMKELMDAMEQINQASQEISKIIKAIDDIAFQTNILALNAAVEAARAGSAGKGFAVVAEEVRNLATKSAEAAKTTTSLIAKSIEAVDNGIVMANQATGSVEKVVGEAKAAGGLISEISIAANSQATAISQVTQGVQQISGVVQSSSATVEESTAALEELSAQAQQLNALVSQFQFYQQETSVAIEQTNETEERQIENSNIEQSNSKY